MGALASIAILNYLSHVKKARAAHCLANRYNIEMAELAYFLEHNEPNLKIDDLWSCPSDGVYVWLISDANDPSYPKVGCSIHFWPSEGGKDKDKDKKKKKDKKKDKKKK